MTGRKWQRSALKPGLLALLFCALLARTFVPAGYMIGAAAQGTPALILCPDAGPPPPMAHGPHHQPHAPKHKESPCPFGALAAPAMPPPPVALAAASPPGETELLGRPPAAVALALAAPPPPSTGPPSLS